MAAARSDMSGEEAQYLAIQALGFLGEEPERLERFMALTGITVDTLKREAGSRPMLVAVLQHLLGDESLLLTFAANSGADPASIARAHQELENGRDGAA